MEIILGDRSHVDLTSPCKIDGRTKRPITTVRTKRTASGFTRVTKARLLLCDRFDIHFEQLDSSVHCCHACQDERCLNVDHLYFGTAKDNQGDVSPEVKSRASKQWDRRKRFVAIDPSGIRFVSDNFSRLVAMIGSISSATFYKHAALGRAVTQTFGQAPNKWSGWMFKSYSV